MVIRSGSQIWNPVATSSTTTCGSNGVLFMWSAESTTIGTGTPGGCTVGLATSGTLTNGAAISATQYEDGTHSLSFTNSGSHDYISFSVSSEDTLKHTAGTIDLWTRPTTTISNTVHLFATGGGTGNEIDIQGGSSSQWVFQLESVGSGPSIFTTMPAGYTLGAWWHISAWWSYTAIGGIYAKICSDTSTLTQFATTNCATYGSALPTWSSTISALQIGTTNGSYNAGYIDNITIYSTAGGF